MSAPTRSLLDQSDRTRRAAYRGVTRDPLAAMPAEHARREFRRTLALIRTAVSMAAAERKRHGKDCPPDMRADAAQDVTLEMAAAVAANVTANLGEALPEQVSPDIGAGLYPLADLIDQDRPTVAGQGGERIQDRPNRDLIAAAGAKLDAALTGQALSLDALAGDGADLIAASDATRDHVEGRRSVAPQVVDPSVSPVPADVEEVADWAGLWPDDPMRHALRVAVTGDADDPNPRHGMTAEDWAAVDAQEYRDRKPASIRKRLQRGREAADQDREALAHLGRGLAQCLALTDPPPELLPNLTVNPDGERRSVTLPDRWRVTIDQDASMRTLARLPRRKRRQVPPMPAGWRREQGADQDRDQGAEEVTACRTIEEIHAEHAAPPRKRTRARRTRTRRGKLPAYMLAHVGRLIETAARMERERRGKGMHA